MVKAAVERLKHRQRFQTWLSIAFEQMLSRWYEGSCEPPDSRLAEFL